MLVHTSFRAVRPVDGGPRGLIDALRAALGPDGTLVMPAMTDGAAVFDPRTTPTCDMGVVAEQFWRQPGVVRSTHPGASFAAAGPHAARICAPQPLAPPHGPASPVGRVHDLDGQVLLLGVGHGESTTMHLAESLGGAPYALLHPCVVEIDGVAQTVMIPEPDHCCRGFAAADGWLRARGLQREGTVGHAHARLVRARDAVAAAVEHLAADPLVFLCAPDAACDECDRARASVPAAPAPVARPAPHAGAFYSELARWWPLISPVEEYAGEAAEFLRVLRAAAPEARTVLELGSGGGHNAYYLKRAFALTLADLSEHMLDVSRRLNPECEHVRGDMRALDLGRTFDAVFVHDAVDYMITEAELGATMATAHRHCRPGGVALFVPDAVLEHFEPDSSCDGHDGPDGEAVRYLEWSYLPDPDSHVAVTHYAFITRERDGTVRTLGEPHLHGLFPRATWVRLLEQAGFAVEVLTERTDEDRPPRLMFLARRP